jgi:hypothetical protein
LRHRATRRLFDGPEQHHRWIAERIEELAALLLVCEPLLAEPMYLLARQSRAQDALFELLQNGALRSCIPDRGGYSGVMWYRALRDDFAANDDQIDPVGEFVAPMIAATQTRPPFKVGVATRAFVPAEPYEWRGGAKHALATMIWYPADSGRRGEAAVVRPSEQSAVRWRARRRRCVLAPTPTKFPLIVLSHGTGAPAERAGTSPGWGRASPGELCRCRRSTTRQQCDRRLYGCGLHLVVGAGT